ncbi:PAS domain-containing protein [uncultured Pseudoteredinibacter sp.]|uniref:PAS domain-containing protein n=1 Tax=uncultured Pseudoteredinibacter sp. TaxID=1641701 RepID=UPI00262BA5EC|nr:PAS domain-containing protein [uncultured Pseudoteredinibacter sp.]
MVIAQGKRPKITAINKEIELADDDLIVSKTDVTGKITYINRTFMRISGFVEKELIGIQHNVIRHKDMPRGVFRKMWADLKDNKEFFGYVKNLCKDGSFYWVFANVTPDFDESGNLRGYYSVRRKPGRQAVQLVESLYQKMREEEKQGDKKSAPDRSWRLVDQHLEKEAVSYNRFMVELDANRE